jgi:hypothetical protein
MTQPPSDPNPLNYQSPPDPTYVIRPSHRGAGKRFALGLAIGSLLSLIYWPSVWSTLERPGASANLLWLIPVIKFTAAMVLMFFPGKRAIAAGLLTSLITGFAIFFGTCAANF